MDITESGPRCFRCSQTAAIAQHEHNRTEAIRSHNKAVGAFAFLSFRFWSLEFHCSECDEELDTGPGIFSISRPPAQIRCEKCGGAHAVDFWHRARWWASSLFKVCLPIIVAIRYRSLRAAIATGSGSEIATTLFFDVAIACIAGIVLAIPAAFVPGDKQAAPR